MITMADLKSSWTAIVPQMGQSIGRRADNTHPLPFFISYDEEGKMQMMLISDFLPKLPQSSQQISVRGNQRADGQYAICLSLEDNTLREQYIALCWDLLYCTYNVTNIHKGVISAVKRFHMWQKLFAERKNNKMSDNEIKGLIGELAAFRDIALKKYSPQTAAEGWVGPIGADRDFEFSDTWYEIKTTSLSRPNVSISSFDQLDSNTDGYLTVFRIEKASGNITGCISLNSLIREIKTALSCNSNALSVFEGRLIASGYEEADARSDMPFMLHKKEYFEVCNNFPCIRRTELPTAIANGTYELSIAGIQKWKCSEAQAVLGVKVG